MTHSDLYEATLRSPRWRQLKWRRLLIARFRCERCRTPMLGKRPRAAMRQFDLHHLHYDRVSEERLEDVRVVCRDCHKDIHGL